MSSQNKLRELIEIPGRVYMGRLAEDYDGISQYATVSLARSSVAAAYKVRVAAGDFGGGRRIPINTPVVVTSVRGQLEVLLGNRPRNLCRRDDFNRVVGFFRKDLFSREESTDWGIAEFEDLQYLDGGGFISDGIAVLDQVSDRARLNFSSDLRLNSTVEILVKMRLPSDGDVAVGFTDSAVSLNTGTAACAFFTLTRTGSTLILRSKRGNSSTQQSVTFSTSYDNEWVWVRCRKTNSQVRSKIWFDGVPEPFSNTITHTSHVDFATFNLVFQNGIVTGNRGEFDYFEFSISNFPDRNTNWGTGSLGTWLSINDMLVDTPPDVSFDESAWVGNGSGLMRFSGYNDPVQGLRFDGGLNLPIEITFQASWTPSPINDKNWLFYVGPFFHYDWNAWLSWAGFYDNSPEGFFIDISIAEQGIFLWDNYINYDHPDTKFFDQFNPTEYDRDDTYRWKIRIDSTGFFGKFWPMSISEPSEWSTAIYWAAGPPPKEWMQLFYFETQASGGEEFILDWFQVCSPSFR